MVADTLFTVSRSLRDPLSIDRTAASTVTYHHPVGFPFLSIAPFCRVLYGFFLVIHLPSGLG